MDWKQEKIWTSGEWKLFQSNIEEFKLFKRDGTFICDLVPVSFGRIGPRVGRPSQVSEEEWGEIREGVPCPSDNWTEINFPDPTPRPTREWGKEFQIEFPNLFEKAPYFGFQEGWIPLMKEFCRELTEKAPGRRLEVGAKEKYAGLEIVLWDEKGRILRGWFSSLCEKYWDRSQTICEVCGDPGKWEENENQWEKIRCHQHREGRDHIHFLTTRK